MFWTVYKVRAFWHVVDDRLTVAFFFGKRKVDVGIVVVP
jgi:hypothetical protein